MICDFLFFRMSVHLDGYLLSFSLFLELCTSRVAGRMQVFKLIGLCQLFGQDAMFFFSEADFI